MTPRGPSSPGGTQPPAPAEGSGRVPAGWEETLRAFQEVMRRSVTALRYSEQTDKLMPALVKLQGLLDDARKTGTAEVKTKSGAKYTYDYANLSTCLPAIREHAAGCGLFLAQAADSERKQLVTRITHTSTQWVESDYPCAPDRDPQTMGANTTYARRYGLFALLGIVAVEDDTDAVAAKPKPKPRKPREPKAPNPDHHASWPEDRAAFCARLNDLHYSYELIADFCTWLKRPRPSRMSQADRTKLLRWIQTDGGMNKWGEWQDSLQGAA